MSKASTRTHEAIADDAIEFIEYGHEHSTWLSALMGAICLDAEHNRGRRVADLATLGQYLAEDCANYLDNHGGKLRRELEGGEA